MKTLSFLIWIVLAGVQHNDPLKLRNAYVAAAVSKQQLQQFQKMLLEYPGNAPVWNCYRGAAEMLSARYAFNPVTKITAFNKGKSLIEDAIAADSLNPECRYIRYGIQKNLPAFLNYSGQLNADSIVLARSLDTLQDHDLKSRIEKLIKR